MMSLSKPITKPIWQRAIITMSATVTTALLICGLYMMRSLLIPIALALFFTYVLTPLVTCLQRHHVGKIPSVILVVLATVVVFGAVSLIIAHQVAELSNTLAEHKDQLKEKVINVRGAIVGDGHSRWGRIFNELSNVIIPEDINGPLEVVVKPSTPLWMSGLDTIAGPVTEAVGQTAFAFILVVFMLFAKDDLRDRLLRLIGDGSVTSATRAAGDVSRRVSRYLLSQLILNSVFGLICMSALYALGVRYAMLWGFLAFLMRYIPYIGIWIGVIPPVLFTFAVSNGCLQPVGVLAVYLGLEVVCNNAVEPRLYGGKLGVSEIALLVSAAFWSFIWGPVGLILSGPITTCLLVVGIYVPTFRFLFVLLGTESPLTPGVALFQRLTARNQDEAVKVVEASVTKDNPMGVFDLAILPALTLIKQAKANGEFEAEEEKQILEIAEEVIEDLVVGTNRRNEENDGQSIAHARVLACPAFDEADRLSLLTLSMVLVDKRWKYKLTSVDMLISELLDAVRQFKPHVIVIGSLQPSGISHVRYICKRLRSRYPDVRLIVGRWGLSQMAETTEKFTDAGASAVVSSIEGARSLLNAWLPVLTASELEGPADLREVISITDLELIGTNHAKEKFRPHGSEEV